MSDMMQWADYYLRMTSNPDLTIDQQVSFFVAAREIIDQIRKEANRD